MHWTKLLLTGVVALGVLTALRHSLIASERGLTFGRHCHTM
jgi:hypothetical protein